MCELREYVGKLVPITYPAKRCCAPKCGDKIKGSKPGDTMVEVVDLNGPGQHGYLEHICIDNFEQGHPDLPDSARGKLVFER